MNIPVEEFALVSEHISKDITKALERFEADIRDIENKYRIIVFLEDESHIFPVGDFSFHSIQINNVPPF